MKKLLSFQTMRQLLALSALIVVGLLIWFVGPLIAFGGLKPLAGVGMRILAIALLLITTLLWLAGLTTSIAFVFLLCLLIWYATPLLAFGHTQPFETESARGLAIAVVLSVVAIYWLVRLWKRMRSDTTFRSWVLELGGKEKASSAAARQIEEVTETVSTAISRLRSMRTGGRGLGRLFQGKRYLYELPWYIILGTKSAGKTVGVLNAGLSFPVAEQMQKAMSDLANGVSTAHVDWWLTNDAVLIDTAGNYTQQRPALPSVSTSPVLDKQSATGANEPDPPVEVDEQDVKTGGEKLTRHTPTEVSARDVAIEPRSEDAAEWLGFLSLLRKHRPRAPVNGAILAVDLTELISEDKQVRLAQGAALRARLAEMRTELGIRFPVYLVITKMDRLTGFSEYFGSLTAEGRSQTWGFTLPHGRATLAKEGIRARCSSELDLLETRLADGINTRLQDEYNPERRTRLAVLSEEFSGLTRPLIELVETVFLDSRYDTTQVHSTLRGVYFTSAAQVDSTVVADRNTLVQRLWKTLDRRPDAPVNTEPGHQSYFLHDLLTKVVFREAHLVRPNLRWEFRFRLLRLVGHALALLLFAWLASSLWISLGNNRAYLDAIERKTRALSAKVTQLYKAPKPEAVPDTLTDARYLATYPGLDLSSPDTAYRYGLYVAPGIATESRHTYDALEDNLLLPQIVRRMEGVLSDAIARKDSETAYAALRTYLMLQDKAKYNADDVKAWVLSDWANTDSAAVFGGRASMIEHVNALFSGDRIVQSPFVRNDALILQARSFLDANNATLRLYERAKIAMQKEAPEEFTLLRAVGPQAGTVFTRASGEPLARGVPGLFTYDGYRNLFDKRLPEFVQLARDDDAWVMGHSLLGDAQKKKLRLRAPLV